MTPTRLLFAGFFFASGFAYQLTAAVIRLTDERSITAYAEGYVIQPFEIRTAGPYTQTPEVPFGYFGTSVGVSVFNSSVSEAYQGSSISVQSHTTWLYASGFARNSLRAPVPETLVTSTYSSSIYRLGFTLDAEYDYQTTFTLSAGFLSDFTIGGVTEAGYSLIGPLGEVFSFVPEYQRQGYSEIKGSSSGTLVPGNYLLEAWGTNSSFYYRGEGKSGGNADYMFRLGLTPAGEPATPIPDSGLPSVALRWNAPGIAGDCAAVAARSLPFVKTPLAKARFAQLRVGGSGFALTSPCETA
jgi:hypothetical protein